MSRPGSRRQHKKFCDAEGLDLVRDAQGQPVRHHITFELPLADGRILRTRISRPADNTTYGPALWSAILDAHQLDVSEPEFWDCVDRGITPARPGEPAPVPPQALPADLVHQLLSKLKLSEAEVAKLSRQRALDLMAEYRARSTPTE